MGKAEAVGADNFEAKVEKAQTPVLVDFWAAWCGPCQRMTPIVDEVAGEREGSLAVCKVDCEEEDELSGRFGVTGIPCFILFRDGKEVDRRAGACPKEDLLAWVDGALA